MYKQRSVTYFRITFCGRSRARCSQLRLRCDCGATETQLRCCCDNRATPCDCDCNKACQSTSDVIISLYFGYLHLHRGPQKRSQLVLSVTSSKSTYFNAVFAFRFTNEQCMCGMNLTHLA